ncbi:YbaB/EbfC family nucleoid-associated protein [Nocardia sp. NPDC019395]|uniref:YbaB/EbfC family nucleoid-associated protein n=1 Tax=Nocardia sp. NPDC019395 TaxID=3154686 RepID=UPI0033F53448
MGDDDRAATQAASEVLRESVDELLVTFERQRAEMAEVGRRLAATTVTAWSSDNLVRVDANTAGIPVDVHLTAEAFKRSTPEKLGRSILEAVQKAARQAGEVSQQAWAPVAALAGDVPDLPDIAPGMPSIKSLVDTLFPDPVTEPAPAEPMNDEDEDEYFRNRSYLDGGK